MTRAEILNCLTDRPCEVCKFHESGKCERWDCVFEEKPDDAEPCEDCISRQAVDEIKELMTDINGDIVYAVRMSGIRRLPPVTPKQKMGRWIWKGGYHGIPYCHCSECGNGQWEMSWSYCPFCGVKMEESK